MTGPDRGRNAESIQTVVSDVRMILIAVGPKDDLAIVFMKILVIYIINIS